MNRKINKITTWLAAAIFLLALAINVKVTLDDPFMMLSDEAIAQTTTDTSSTGTGTGTGTGTDNLGCGGNSTYLPGKTLKHRVCILVWQNYLKCVDEENVC